MCVCFSRGLFSFFLHFEEFSTVLCLGHGWRGVCCQWCLAFLGSLFPPCLMFRVSLCLWCVLHSLTQGLRTCRSLSHCFARPVECLSPFLGWRGVSSQYLKLTHPGHRLLFLSWNLGPQLLGPVSRSANPPMDFIFQLISFGAESTSLFVPGTRESPFSDSPFKMCWTGGERALKTRVLSFLRVTF